MKNKRSIPKKYIVIGIIVLIIIIFVIFSFTLKEDRKLNKVESFIRDALVYTEKIVSYPVRFVSGKINDYKNYIEKVEATDSKTVVFYSKLDESGNPINPLKVIEYIPKIYVMQKAYLQTVEERNNNDAEKVKEDEIVGGFKI